MEHQMLMIGEIMDVSQQLKINFLVVHVMPLLLAVI